MQKKILIIAVDSYYKDLSNIEFKEREKKNFDHPESIEFDLLYKHLLKIKENKNINIPIYNYKNHTRRKKKQPISLYFIIL